MVWNVGMKVHDQLERIWKERSLPYLKNYPKICLVGLNKTHKAQDSHCSGWDLNQAYLTVSQRCHCLRQETWFCRNLQSHSQPVCRISLLKKMVEAVMNGWQWNSHYVSAVGNADTQKLKSSNTGTEIANYWLINKWVVRIKLCLC